MSLRDRRVPGAALNKHEESGGRRDLPNVEGERRLGGGDSSRPRVQRQGSVKDVILFMLTESTEYNQGDLGKNPRALGQETHKINRNLKKGPISTPVKFLRSQEIWRPFRGLEKKTCLQGSGQVVVSDQRAASAFSLPQTWPGNVN